MENRLDLLVPYIPNKVTFVRQEEDNLFEGINYDIRKEKTAETIGACVYNTAGELLNYHYFGEEKTGSISINEVENMSKAFIQTFYPNGLEKYTLDAVIDLDDTFIINYGIRDEKYGVMIPHVGFTITISVAGHITQFSHVDTPYDIDYPTDLITAIQAKERYLSKITCELVIQQLDKEIFANGDDQAHLLYRLHEEAMDIPANGEEPFTVIESTETKAIHHQDIPYKTVYDLIGLDETYLKVGEQTLDNEHIELWAHYDVQLPSDIDFTDEYCEQVIRIVTHKDNYHLLNIHNGEFWRGSKDNKPLPTDILEQHALDFMFLLFPDAHEKFRLEMTDSDEAYEAEDEDDLDFTDEIMEAYEHEEETLAFYFQKMQGNIPIEDDTISIEVGLYTGRIKNFFMNHTSNPVSDQLQTKPKITPDEAKEIYANALEMELIFVVDHDEDGKEQLKLSYVPSFPKTIGHIQRIDAQTGKAYYVDVGASLFY